MEEQIYQSVWCQTFAGAWQWAAAQEDDGETTAEDCETFASAAADLAAAAAVRRWSAAKQHAAIVAANKEKP